MHEKPPTSIDFRFDSLALRRMGLEVKFTSNIDLPSFNLNLKSSGKMILRP